MKHSIRQRVIDPVTGLKVTKIETVTGELGSGIFDKNGKEIFEGDAIQTTKGLFEIAIMTGGEFCAISRSPNIAVSLRGIPSGEMEILGHAENLFYADVYVDD
ncbi:MAG: hypothetical protein IJ774_08800 [Selenomonadaceae bacterium]|nr:hypothetical protein [Selenomonadaceae bacterium]